MKEQFLNLTGLTELVGYLKTSIANHKEILPYASNKLFPSVGDINTIYINTATNTIYRWDSSSKTYITLAKAVKSVAISESTENGKITLTVDGNKTTVPVHGLGSAAYTNSSAYSSAGHTHTKAQVGLGNVDNTADANKSVKHATTAGTATNVSAGEGTADAARHVWFSDSTTETKRAYSDKFKYNPVTNNLTVNVTGNAATASSVAWGNITGKPSTYTPSAHNHNDSTITSLNASKLFGTIDIARLPHGALERLVIVEDDTARFKLTTANIQLGDTVKVTKTEKMYYVVDESKLSSEAGYSVYTAGTATSVPWSGVTEKPSSYPPASHNHDERYYTETEMNSKLAEKATKVHTHVKSEVGLGNVDNTADANKSVKYATSAGSSTTSGAISSSGTLDTVAKLDAFIEGGKVKYATVSALDGLNGMIKNDGICISTPWSSTGYGHQFYINDNGYDLYHRFRNTSKVNNVDTTTWSSWKQILDSSNYNSYAPTKTGSGASGTWGISVTGNAATATKLATARSINGTNFDGSGNITTATWGTARNVTIGSTKKSVNGGADVSWSLSEIGAAAASHSHAYLPLSGGTLTGNISYKGSKATFEMIKFIDNTGDTNGNGIAIGGGGLTIVGGGKSSDIVKTIAPSGGEERLILSNDGPIDIYTNCQDGLSKATHITIDNTGLYSGTAAKANSVPWTGVTGRPSSMPASDVYSWAKAASKPSYTKSEVGLGNVDNTADSAKSVKYAISAGSASSAATLTSNAGSATQPVYFSDGKPTACTYTLGKSVPADALFTDHTYGNMKGATSSSAGSAGLVPAPNIGEQLKFLRADGAWVIPTNTTYSVGTSSYLGITKLYTETGSATDGTMTQNAITTALNGKSPTSHTHNYAGSSSSGGAANSANKLATARTVSGGTDITLSFNYDGSGNSSANIGFYSSSASVGDKNNYPFHRFAKLDTIAASYSDKSTTFFISQDYSGGGFGIVRIVLRTNNSSLASTVEVKWLVRCGLSADSVQVGIYNVFGKTYADAFFKTGGSYAGTCFRTLASGARGGISRTWVLVNSSEVSGTSATDAKTSTECYATIAAAGTALHKQAYSSIVSGTDSGTASYANSAGSANSVAWGNVTGKPSTFAPSSHTHNYAGSSSAGGAATSAIKLSTPRKIGNASFDGTADITLSQMGLNVPVEITKANYLAKKKAGTLNANTYYNVIDEYDSANVINDSSVTANSAFSSTKSEKTYAKKSTLVNTTLTASKWTGSSAPYSYVLSVSGVTSSNIVEIDYASNASSAAIEAYQNAMLADGGQTTNQITIKATEKPTVDIPITIVIRNDL